MHQRTVPIVPSTLEARVMFCDSVSGVEDMMYEKVSEDTSDLVGFLERCWLVQSCLIDPPNLHEERNVGL
jgi:hypothetical protein